MKKFLYVEPDDKVIDIVNKIQRSKEKTINLVVPATSSLFTTKKFKEFSNQSPTLKKDIIFHSNDQSGLEMAKKFG
ncbi:hypothetical protein KJ855_00335, partial [Patescibacteria group bacterium]|nr:hypothetical protein [Patescibacteria group bacterium]